MFDAIDGDRLTKRRFHVADGGYLFAVDRFEDALEGLVLCEIEADGLDELMRIAPPDFVEREVTQDDFFSGANLCRIDAGRTTRETWGICVKLTRFSFIGEPRMTDLEFYADIAQILGMVTIVGGGVFAVVQMIEFRRQRRDLVAVELMRSFYNPEFSRSVTIIRSLPDGIPAAELRARGVEYEQAALLICMMYETMGLLVFRKIASFQLAQELTGGLIEVLWRKLHVWVGAIRLEQAHPRFHRMVRVARDPVREARSSQRTRIPGLSRLAAVNRTFRRPRARVA